MVTVTLSKLLDDRKRHTKDADAGDAAGVVHLVSGFCLPGQR